MKVEQLAPRRRLLTDSFQGEPLDCVGGVINDLTADSRGGVYFTMGGLFYADARGVVTRHGENLATNGIILSAMRRRSTSPTGRRSRRSTCSGMGR